MFPGRDYAVVIRKAISEVVLEVQWALKGADHERRGEKPAGFAENLQALCR
jgi:hypothetical protein